MQQYYQSVCERQQQALRRNQALQQDVRRAHTFAASGVDTSQLELLKGQYQSSVASTYPHWLAQKRENCRQLQTFTSEGYNMPLSVPSHKTVVASGGTTLVSTTYTTSAPYTSHAPVAVSTSTVLVNSFHLLSTGSSPTQPLAQSKLGPTSYITSSLHGSMQSRSSQQPDTLVASSTPPLPAKITNSPVECSSSSAVCELSLTMHAVTEPSTVAASKMEIAEHVSHLKTHFEGKQLSPTDLPAPVVTKIESLAVKCIAESVPSFPTTSKHSVPHAEQPSHSTLLATEPTAIHVLTSNKQMTDSSANDIHVTIPPKHTTATTTHSLTQTISALSSVTSTQLPANTSLPPILRNDPINSNLQQQPSTQFSITSTQPQSVLILSQEGSEPSLSQTETPLDLTDDDYDDGKEGGKQACENGTQNMNTGLVAPQERKDRDLVDSDRSDLESIDSLLPDNGLHLPIEHAQVLDQRPTDAQAKRGHSSAKNKENSHRMGESIKREHAVLSRGKDEGIIPVAQGEGEVNNPSDGSDSASIPDVIPSLSPLPQHPQQKMDVNKTSVIMDGSSSSTESQAELCKTRDEDRGVQTPLLDPKPQDGADAYATFLQSVCQSSAIDSPPLDSDSDGIDAILTGQQKERDNGQDNTSVSSHSAAVESAVNEGGLVTDRGRKHHSLLSSGSNQLKVHTKSGGRERRDDASDSESSQSVQAPSYVPTMVEKQSTSQSTLLKKRPGFWGSDDSLDGSDLADSPTASLAKDDKEDFDFHV